MADTAAWTTSPYGMTQCPSESPTVARTLPPVGDGGGAASIQGNDHGVLLSGVTCSKCGFDGHNSRTCEGPHWPCPTCGKPTANMNDYSERHDDSYCSPLTSSRCWG